MCSTQQLEIKAIQILGCLWLGLVPLECYSQGVSTNVKTSLMNQIHLFTESLVRQVHPDATRVTINIQSPDPRIVLDDCATPRISQHGGQQLRSRILVKIECSNKLALHVPVDIAVYKPILVAAVAMPRQKLIVTDDLVLKEIDILNNRITLTDPQDATGKRLKRRVRAGTILTLAMLAEPTLVERGDGVVIFATKGSLVVKMPGIAIEDGTMNEQIKVKNQSSGRVVMAWVRGPGKVQVPL